MNFGALIRGLPGHPSHPPLTGTVIGAYTFATIAALADTLGISDNAATHGWWLALVTALLLTIPTAVAGFADWVTISSGTPLWRTATAHMIVMLIGSAVFLATVIVGKNSFDTGDVSSGSLILTLIGFGVLALGGWIGGAITYVHGMRVLELQSEPAKRAVSPFTPEKGEAERR
ncbi:MAG: DUF2231 domain-containing protein [Pseudomonadota bacterium]